MCSQKVKDCMRKDTSQCVSLDADSGRGLSVESDPDETKESRMLRWRRGFLECSCWKRKRPCLEYCIDPYGKPFLLWMLLVVIGFVYNAIVIPLRFTFPVQSGQAIVAWLVFDYLFDLVYLLDIVLVQFHLGYWVHGVLETNLKLLAARYMRTPKFWCDIIALTPLDLLYIIPVLRYQALLRLPRLLKLGSWNVFYKRFEFWTQHPNTFRAIKLVSLFFYAIHLYSCIYYLVSKVEGFTLNAWVYDGNGNSYIRCFYWATVRVITSHSLDRGAPSTLLEYAVDVFSYLIGIFILALVIGEIRNITEATLKHKTEAYQTWDRVKEYLRHYRVPSELQQRVLSWYDNVLLTDKYQLGESQLVDTLPDKMKADLAINIHLDTLLKVSLFKDCDKSLLSDLVLKLRPLLFVPGDFICKKGEIGKEMYIVQLGKVQVIGGADNGVLTDLGPGAVFGEISLLGLKGGNRRTVHVRSKGFSRLFVLSKKDLHSTLLDYPEAQEALLRKSQVGNNPVMGKSKVSSLKSRMKRRVTPVEVHPESGSQLRSRCITIMEDSSDESF